MKCLKQALRRNLIKQIIIAWALLCISTQQQSKMCLPEHSIFSVQTPQTSICLVSLRTCELPLLIPGKSAWALPLKSLRQTQMMYEIKGLANARRLQPSLSHHICASFPLAHPQPERNVNSRPRLLGIQFPDPSQHQTNHQKKQPCREQSCADVKRPRARMGERAKRGRTPGKG